MSWLSSILIRGAKLRLKEMGQESTLPDNPTIADIKKEAISIGQLAKEIQNESHHWSDDQWRKISKAIEALESKK